MTAPSGERTRNNVAAQGTRLKLGREQAGLSVGQAAVLLGVSSRLLRAVEGTEPSHSQADLAAVLTFRFDKAEEAADLYGVSLAWLQGAEPYVPPDVESVLARSSLPEAGKAAVRSLVGSTAERPAASSTEDWFQRAFGDDA